MIGSKRVRAFLVGLFVTFTYAASLAAQPPTGTVAGRVVDAATAQPLEGVVLRIGERSALSGGEGRFTITQVPAGSQTVVASRLGYADASVSVTVTAGQTTTIQVEMTGQALELEGLVVIGYGERTRRDLTGVVQQVGAEEFNRGRIVSTEQLIQAKVPGVQVIDTGEPGGGISLRIRGGTSVTSSNEPLFVIDGVPLAVGGGLSAGRNALNFLNPQDIESVTVLKDASATAIYGSRGANGVVLIETRGGASGSRLEYRGTLSTSTVTRQADILDAATFRSAVQQQAPDRMPLLGSASTDWRDAVQRDATGQEHSLAFSGGTDAINYRFSLGYLDQQGVIRGSETERISASANYNHSLLDDRLSLGANLKGTRTEDRFTPSGVIGAATSFAPTQPILDAASPYGGFYEWTDPLGPNNPVAELNLITDDGTTYRSVGNVTGTYRLPVLEGLSTTVNLGYDVSKVERRTFSPSFLRGQAENGTGGTVTRANPTQSNTLIDAYATYARQFGVDGSSVELTAGHSREYLSRDSAQFDVQGLSFDLLGPNGVPDAEIQRSLLRIDESRLVSWFARANYDYRDRYLLTLSVRRDGSSKFGPSEQWGTFPSAAVAWRLSEESFLEGVDGLTDLKLRVSWGVNGNQAFPSYRAFSDYVIGGPAARAQFGDEYVTTIRPSAADPSIKWEETTSLNVGLDFGILSGRLSGSLEWYTKETEDLIFNVPIAAGTNLSNFVTTNIGTLENDGVELNLDALLVDGGADGLSWTANFNAATNSNELVQINPVGGGTEQVLTGGISGGVGTNIQVLQPGYPINSFFVYRHRRSGGQPIYSDTNGDGNIDDNDLYEDLNGDGIINQDDRSPFKNPAPDWILGHTSQLGYRGFDLSFTLLAQLGNHVYNNVASNLGHYSALNGNAPSNLHASVLETEFVRPQYFSDVYVEDGSFLRMDNLSLGYTFGEGRLSGMRVFAAVQNVFLLTDYTGVDPTAGVNGIDNNIYPRSRTFSAGISVGF